MMLFALGACLIGSAIVLWAPTALENSFSCSCWLDTIDLHPLERPRHNCIGVFHPYKLQLNWISLKDAIKDKLTVHDNVTRFEVLEGKLGRSEPTLELMGLGRLIHEKARLLSMGQRKRLQLARVLAIDRPIWLLDEPTVVLDDEGEKLLGRGRDDEFSGSESGLRSGPFPGGAYRRPVRRETDSLSHRPTGVAATAESPPFSA
ncbi:uncharacterized protein LOC130791356 [Actinidia eriantha]|uniref:uncharacterized protein LOC130791356 n=1 Tax=Actinidia eriantha TaxID=165200 RepID=UPI00258948BA|nr:uncharacterized protein LOC130791356 [Actinidia eriantha]